MRTKAAGHLDLAPTLLSLLGISEPPLMLGSDMTAEGEGVVAFRDGSFATDTAYSVEPPQLGPRTFCIGIELDQPVGCRALEAQRARALEGLRLSDLVIHGNLVPALGPEATRSTSRPDAP